MTPKLNSLYIYLTDDCNLKCTHCWQSAPLAGKRDYSFLKFAGCKKFLDDTVALGLRNITFSGGEPLLNPDFHKFAEYFKNNSIHTSMETNGMLLSKKKNFGTVKDCGVYCAISLDGVNPGTHNLQRGSKMAFHGTMKGIRKLEEEKIEYQLIMAISKFNYHELIPLLDWIKDDFKFCRLFKINVVHELGRAGQMNKEGLLFKAEEFPEITEDIGALVGKYPFKIMLHVEAAFFSFKNLMLNYSIGGHCGFKHSLSILANGNISICSLGKQMEKYIFGHVSTIDIKNIWETNPILNEIHDNIHSRLQGVCKKCIFRKQCVGGCRAAALCSYGDFYASSPSCQAYYDSGKFPRSRLIDVNN